MKRLFILSAVLALLVVPASAVVVIDFGTGTAGAGGTVTVSGSNATGSNIPLGSMTVLGTASADGVYDTYGTAAGSGNGSAALSFNTAAGTISVVGGVCVLGNSTCNGGANTLVTSTTLLTGTFSSFTLIGSGSPVLSFNTSGPDTKDPTLLAALGIPTNFVFNYLIFNFSADFTSPYGPTYTATSTDVVNTGAAVPEPLSILLLGTVLVGVSQLVRRRANV